MQLLKPVVSAIFLIALCVAQQPQKAIANADKNSPASVVSFSCPDPQAKTACHSYLELLKAKDSGLPSNGFVCFRTNRDQFFVIHFSPPFFTRHQDKDTKQWLPDSGQKTLGMGYLESYKNGVSDASTMPGMFFQGNWSPLGDGVFISNSIDYQPEPEGRGGTVTVNDSQFSVTDYRYKSKVEHEMSYILTVQRSTGRFAESLTEVGKNAPIAEDTGRCIWHGSR